MRKFSTNDMRFLKSNLSPGYEIIVPKDYTTNEVLDAVGSADVILGESIDRDIMKAAKNVKLLQAPGTAVSGIDLDAADELDIIVCNSHSGSHLVAEYTVAMLLSLMKSISISDRYMRKKNPTNPRNLTTKMTPFPVTLMGRTIGLLGFGHIGREVSSILQSFRTKIIYHATSNYNKEYCEWVSLEYLLTTSDVIIISLPLTKRTLGMINKISIQTMKKGVFIVNVGRAEVIKEADLYNALLSKHIGGVALDVWWKSNVDSELAVDMNYPFYDLDNIIMSPHSAARDVDGSKHLLDVVQNLSSFRLGENVKNIIDLELGY
ncbi:hypothetical protein N9735_01330 [Oceanospirillaceae bacterium]|nr:hypothetical protein [bacterium]MDB4214354.1 hypothetical protein [Oceanospirillaceae bacterium]